MYTRAATGLAATVLCLLALTAAGDEGTVRFATFNVSMYREVQGALLAELADPRQEQARRAAAILQEVRPDVVLLNEFDWDAGGEALRRFHDRFLAVSQDGREPLHYPYRYVAESNTGIPSGFDLDRDGRADHPPGTREYGNDAFGYGVHPGEYAMAVLSRYPIPQGEVRTFRLLRWSRMPGALIPREWYGEAASRELRLSSKNHVDLPIDIGGRIVHLLASHPTPPSFDGPEDRNGRRNHDEIRFWSLYLDAAPGAGWLVDDQGRAGGLAAGAAFVIAGDLNSDPFDGSSRSEAIRALLGHPRVRGTPAPRSPGAAEQARLQGGLNASHRGDPAEDTADLRDDNLGNLRLDYVLPSIGLSPAGSGVFWPAADDPLFALVGTHPFPVSDHRLVWVDVRLPSRHPEEDR
jgi:endonuclease/exonuclease/phosphatase family metal-dependent hydrolase